MCPTYRRYVAVPESAATCDDAAVTTSREETGRLLDRINEIDPRIRAVNAANPHALEFYRAAGFTGCGTADTIFGAAPRMVLAIR